MEKPTIADVLHRAADEFLAVDYHDLISNLQKQAYTCFAIHQCLYKYEDEGFINREECDDLLIRIRQGLSNMGINLKSYQEFGYSINDQVMYSKENQGKRYAWLKFAAMIAEEQGV